MALIGKLFDGPLDLIGDVHGEIEALHHLLSRMGYDAEGRHPEGRRLVFVGDLCDRGPDSPAVLDLVGALVAAGRAQCVLGNHELNILRGSRKEGNGWFFEDNHDRDEGKFLASTDADADRRRHYLSFLGELPIALESPELRVVHACWNETSVQEIKTASVATVADLFTVADDAAEARLASSGLLVTADNEAKHIGDSLRDPDAAMSMLHGMAQVDEIRQMGNPVRVLTSGVERIGEAPFFSSGKWRMVERAAWWNDYRGAVPVVIGHYWRWPVSVDRRAFGKGGKDLFEGVPFDEALGPDRNVYCIDYSVGRRFQERLAGHAFLTRLGALRWPERELVFDRT